jgi:asparagine synthetase B (glutamine-hydrolysing)
MIFAVLAPRREEALSRIERLAALLGAPSVRMGDLVDGGAAVAVWPSAATQVDEPSRTAFDGDLEGELATRRVVGRFAAAQIDAAGRLVLGRGRMGGRPMYWAREGDVVVASTRIGPLVASLGRPAALDRARLAELILWDMAARRSATIYEGVHRLAAGEVLTFDARGLVAREALPTPSLSPIVGTPDELAEALRAEVFAAIERAVLGKRRVAVACGGGVDSGALLAATVSLARGASPKEVEALAMDFAGPGDDRPHMRALADALGLVPVRVSPSAFAPRVAPVAEAYG